MSNKKESKDSKGHRNKEKEHLLNPEEVLVIVEGQRFHFPSDILAKQSKVFEQLIKENKERQRKSESKDEIDFLAEYLTPRVSAEVGIEIERFKYSEVKPALDMMLSLELAGDLTREYLYQ